MMKKTYTIFTKELKELIRDPLSLLTVFILPITMMLVFGFGMKLDIKHVPFEIVDMDNSPLSRDIASRFLNNREYFNFKGSKINTANAEKDLLKGKIRFYLLFPPNFEKNYKKGKTAELQAIIDGTFPYRAEVIKSYINAIISNFNLKNHNQLLKVSVEPRYWFNESLNQQYLTVVGTLAIVMLISPAVFASLLITKEKESGSIYNIYSSPIKTTEYLTGKLLFASLISLLNFSLLLFMTVSLFKVPFKGNWIILITGSVLYVLTAVSFGLLLSNFFKRQVSAFIGSIILTVVPSILYSGYMTPVSSMDRTTLLISQSTPTFHYLNLLKDEFFKAAPLSVTSKELIVLLLFFTAFFLTTTLTFKKRET